MADEGAASGAEKEKSEKAIDTNGKPTVKQVFKHWMLFYDRRTKEVIVSPKDNAYITFKLTREQAQQDLDDCEKGIEGKNLPVWEQQLRFEVIKLCDAMEKPLEQISRNLISKESKEQDGNTTG